LVLVLDRSRMAMGHLRCTQGVGAGSDSPQLESDKYSIKQAEASLDEKLTPYRGCRHLNRGGCASLRFYVKIFSRGDAARHCWSH
jgi:hypothetical protein